MKRNAVSLTMAAAMLTGMLGSVPAFAADLSNLPDKVGEGTITATPDMYPDTDLSKPYTVNMYLIGDTPNDWDMVEEKINEYLEPFNTQIETTFMSWSDYNTMYTLVLAGGEQVDLIFTAPWCYMYTEAAKGSFYDLSEISLIHICRLQQSIRQRKAGMRQHWQERQLLFLLMLHSHRERSWQYVRILWKSMV